MTVRTRCWSNSYPSKDLRKKHTTECSCWCVNCASVFLLCFVLLLFTKTTKETTRVSSGIDQHGQLDTSQRMKCYFRNASRTLQNKPQIKHMRTHTPGPLFVPPVRLNRTKNKDTTHLGGSLRGGDRDWRSPCRGNAFHDGARRGGGTVIVSVSIQNTLQSLSIENT